MYDTAQVNIDVVLQGLMSTGLIGTVSIGDH